MKFLKQVLRCATLAAVTAAWFGPALNQAHAATAAGVTISNTASVDFKVGGIAQTTVSSNTSTFLVDRKIDLVVTNNTGIVSVSPGQTGAAIQFTITNNSNAPLDFNVAAATQANAQTTAAPGLKSVTLQMTNYKVFSDVSGAPGSVITSVSAIAAGGTVKVWVEADTPGTATNGLVAGTILTATAVEPVVGGYGSAGTVVAQTAAADTAGSVDTVFADIAGFGGDTARDGKFGAGGEFDVSSAAITVVKTSKVISDPFNLTVNPKAIPGAIVEYCIQVTNAAGGAAATAVTVTDTIPVNTTYATGTILSGGTVTAGVCNADGSSVTDATGFITGPPAKVTTTIASVAAGVTTTTRFRVSVN